MFWDQTLTFVKEANGIGMGAQGKMKNPGVRCFDDMVIAEALSAECDRWMPGYYKKELDMRPDWLIKVQKKNKTTGVMSV